MMVSKRNLLFQGLLFRWTMLNFRGSICVRVCSPDIPNFPSMGWSFTPMFFGTYPPLLQVDRKCADKDREWEVAPATSHGNTFIGWHWRWLYIPFGTRMSLGISMKQPLKMKWKETKAIWVRWDKFHVVSFEPRKKPAYFSIYWLFNRDPYLMFYYTPI